MLDNDTIDKDPDNDGKDKDNNINNVDKDNYNDHSNDNVGR